METIDKGLADRLEVAQKLISKFGYVIIPYKSYKPLGFTTAGLWGVLTEYKFTLIGEATLQEWIEQAKIMEAVKSGSTSGKRNPVVLGYILYKFVTD